MDYTFFDVETPNRFHDRICSIGLVRTDTQGNVLSKSSYYVNPEQGFDIYTRNVHGISLSDVRNAPTFDELWAQSLQEEISDSILVAHNASFDMNVLNKCLLAYEIPFFDALHLCTKNMAKRLSIPCSNFQLPSLCSYYGIELNNHHDSLADAIACEHVFWSMLDEVGITAPAGIPFIWDTAASYTHAAESTNQALTDLYGITLGIALDGVILPAETKALTEWQERNRINKRAPFFDAAFKAIDDALSDGVLSMNERDHIAQLCAPFVTSTSGNMSTFAMQQLIGLLRGITADRKVNELEAANLRIWLADYSDLAIPEFSTISTEIESILSDGKITAKENKRLLMLFNKIIDPTSERSDASIVFTGSKFCLSGDFTHGAKSQIEELILDQGGEIAKGVSGKVSYVVVGGEGSEQYAFGNYGTKVKKAMELQDKGKPIQIITEDALFAAL